MANRYAIANGNFSSTATWSDSAAGAGGFSVPVSGDNAYSNGKTVTIDANATCAKISNAAENSATAGGGFLITSAITLNANVNGSTAVGGVCLTVTLGSSVSCTINGNITGGSNTISYAVSITGSGTVNIVGDVTGGSVSNAYALNVLSPCTVNITGSINPSFTGGAAVFVGIGVPATVNITGNVNGGSLNHGLDFRGSPSSIVTITGNVTGSSTNNYYGALCYQYGQYLVVNGNVIGGSGTSAYGIATSGTVAGVGCFVTVNGSATAGTGSIGVLNSQPAATVKVVRAIGNAYGNGSTGISSVVSVNGLNTNYTYVEEIQLGSLGQFPVGGVISLTDKTSNVALMYRPSLSQKTLLDPAATSGLVPAAADVRKGVVYSGGNRTGTCSVPAANQVLSGIGVDATTGAAALSTGSVWDSLTSSMSTSGSIGERLKSASTVSSTGQQIANSTSK